MTKQCETCPECVVLFDDTGYHGCKPDSHSSTCKMCMMEEELNDCKDIQ